MDKKAHRYSNDPEKEGTYAVVEVQAASLLLHSTDLSPEEVLQNVVRVHTTYECLDRTLPLYPKMLFNTPSIPWPSRVLDFSTTFLCL